MIEENSEEWHIINIYAIPVNKNKSPILLIMKAFVAALPAWALVYQNPIKRYEQRPTPSQPKNKISKLPDDTNKSIKNVNNDKYDIKRDKKGSVYMYALEYKWTTLATVVTTKNIIAVKLSYLRVKSIGNSLIFNQDHKFVEDTTSWLLLQNKITEKINAKTKFVQLMIKLPNVPIKEPNDIIEINDIIGKINTNVEFINLLKTLVNLAGIEPTTPRLSSECSTAELQVLQNNIYYISFENI